MPLFPFFDNAFSNYPAKFVGFEAFTENFQINIDVFNMIEKKIYYINQKTKLGESAYMTEQTVEKLREILPIKEKYFAYTKTIGKNEFLYEIRKLEKKEYSLLKLLLPTITTSANIEKGTSRSAKNVISHTGFITIDIDFNNKIQAQDFFDKHKTNKFFHSVGFSASGQGIFVNIEIEEPELTAHKEYFFALEEDFKFINVVIDASCKDIVRNRFLSDNLYINENYQKYSKRKKTDSKGDSIERNYDYTNFSAMPAITPDSGINTKENVLRLLEAKKRSLNTTETDNVYGLVFGTIDLGLKFGFNPDFICDTLFYHYQENNYRLERDYNYFIQAKKHAQNAYPESHSKLVWDGNKKQNLFDENFKKTTIKLDRKYLTDEKGYLPISLPDYCILKAHTGTGKTHAIVYEAKNNNHGLILALPYVILTKQQEARFKDLGVNVVTGETTREQLNEMQGDLYACTFDSIQKAVSNTMKSRLLGKKFILAVDEFHNLTIQNNFRAEAIAKVTRTFHIFNKIRMVSATPELLWSLEGFEIIEFETQSTTTHDYNIIEYDKIEGVRAEIIEECKKTNKTVIRSNNIKFNDFLADFLTKQGLKVVNIHNRESLETEPEYIEILENQRIGYDWNILITTSKLDDGSQIFDEGIGKIIFLGVDSIESLIQFPARFRNSQKLSIDIYTKKKFAESYQIKKSKKTRFDIFQETKNKIDAIANVGKFTTFVRDAYSKCLDIVSNTINKAELIALVNKRYYQKITGLDLKDFLEKHNKSVTISEQTEKNKNIIFENEKKQNNLKLKQSFEDIKADIMTRPEHFFSAFYEYAQRKTKQQLKKLNIGTTSEGIDLYAKLKNDFKRNEKGILKILSKMLYIAEEFQETDIIRLAEKSILYGDKIDTYKALKLLENYDNQELDGLERADAEKYKAIESFYLQGKKNWTAPELIQEFNTIMEKKDLEAHKIFTKTGITQLVQKLGKVSIRQQNKREKDKTIYALQAYNLIGMYDYNELRSSFVYGIEQEIIESNIMLSRDNLEIECPF